MPIATSYTITKPSTVVAGDLLVAVILHRLETPSAPTGWSLFAQTASYGSTVGQQNSVFVKTATSSEPASYTFTYPTENQRIAGTILAVSSGGLRDFQAGATTSSDSTATMPSAALTSGELVIYGASLVYASSNTTSNTFSYNGTAGDLTIISSNAFNSNRQSVAFGRTASITGVQASAGSNVADSLRGFRVVVGNP